jgi:hypothetical protein
LCSCNVEEQTLKISSGASKADKATTCGLLEAEEKGTSAENFNPDLPEPMALARIFTAAYNPQLRAKYVLVSA